jgi:hypothetical protein
VKSHLVFSFFTCLESHTLNSSLSLAPPHGQANHSAYNAQNPPGYENVSQPSSNPIYPGQQQPYVRGPTGYNYPPNPVYGPTSVPMPHQYHTQIN